MKWLDFEVLNDAQGKPYLVLSDAINTRFDHPIIHLSISHCHTYATAVAIWVTTVNLLLKTQKVIIITSYILFCVYHAHIQLF